MWLVVKWWLSTLISWLLVVWTSLVAQVVKNLPAVQVWVQSLCWEVSPGEGNGFPLRYSCLENSTDRGAWRATTERLTQHGCLLPYARVFPFPFIHSFIHLYLYLSWFLILFNRLSSFTTIIHCDAQNVPCLVTGNHWFLCFLHKYFECLWPILGTGQGYNNKIN